MDNKTYDSLCALLDYLFPVEKRHWEEMGRPDDHIYLHLQRLAGWADEVAKDYPDRDE
jgi:hypothetical protein